MIRVSFVSAALVAALATPAAAGDMKVSLVGKTPAQVEAEIYSAARTVCRAETEGALKVLTFRSCVRAAYSGAVAQLADPAMASIAQTKLAQR